MQKQADVITPATEVFFAPFIGQTVTNAFGTFRFPSNGEIPSDYKMFQPRLGISWDPKGDGKTVVRLNGGIFYGRIPGLSLASSRSTNGSRAANALPGQLLQRRSASRRRPTRTCSRRRRRRHARSSRRLRVRRGLPEPAHLLGLGRRRARAGRRTWRSSSSTTTPRASTSPASSRRNDAAFGCPWGTGLGAGAARTASRAARSAGAGLTVVQSTAKSLYDGVTLRPEQALVEQLPVPGQLHDVLGQVRRRQRARSVHLPLRRATTTWRRSTATRTATSATASTASLLWQASGQGERQPALLLPLRAAAVAGRRRLGRRRRPSGPPPTGSVPTASIVERNTGRKDNVFSSFDLRLSREFKRRPERCASSRSSRSSTCSTARTCSRRRPPTWSSTSTARSARPRRSAPGAGRRCACSGSGAVPPKGSHAGGCAFC